MSLLSQLAHSLIWAPLSPLRLRPRAAAYLLLYVACAGAILGGAAWFLVAHQDDLRQVLLRYLLPESWAAAGGVLVDWFLATQTRAVVVNATVGGTLVLISVLLFPLKEKVSAAYERGADLTDDAPSEFPLWFQAVEELKLVLLYVAAQMVILWIGYHPNPLRKQAATLLSFAYLFATFSVDFISPLLQRHRLRYSQILKVLLRHPVVLLSFGALFSLPGVLVGHLVARDSTIAFRDAIVVLFGANLLGIVWGCLGGTWVGAKLLEPAQGTQCSSWLVRMLAWLVLAATLSTGGYLYGGLALSVHLKSQILKCHYSLVPGSLHLDRPRLRSLLRGVVEVGVGFTLKIENPTAHDVVIDRNRLEVRHDETLVATTRLNPMTIPGGEQRVQPVRLTVETHPSALLKGRQLLADRWSVTLFVEVVKGFDFPIYLKHTFARSVREQLLGR